MFVNDKMSWFLNKYARSFAVLLCGLVAIIGILRLSTRVRSKNGPVINVNDHVERFKVRNRGALQKRIEKRKKKMEQKKKKKKMEQKKKDGKEEIKEMDMIQNQGYNFEWLNSFVEDSKYYDNLCTPAATNTSYKHCENEVEVEPENEVEIEVEPENEVDDNGPPNYKIGHTAIKMRSGNIRFNDEVSFDETVLFGNNANVKFDKEIVSNDINVKKIRLNENLTIDRSNLKTAYTNAGYINDKFTDYYLQNKKGDIMKLLTSQELLNKYGFIQQEDNVESEDNGNKGDNGVSDDNTDHMQKKGLVKEFMNIIRDNHPPDADNGLCHQLNCIKHMSEDKEKHHCRAIIMDAKNRSNYTIDMQADENGHAEYHEGAKHNNRNTTVIATGKIDNLNKVLLYKSNDDTKCELVMFSDKKKFYTYMEQHQTNQSPVNTNGNYYLLRPEQFDKNGKWNNIILNNIKIKFRDLYNIIPNFFFNIKFRDLDDKFNKNGELDNRIPNHMKRLFLDKFYLRVVK